MASVNPGNTLQKTWHALPRRDGSPLPFWQDIKAHHLAPVMSHVWVLEHVPAFHMFVKFMGTEVTRLGGRDTTGDDFLNTRIPANQRPYIMSIYRNVYEAKCGVCLTRIVNPLGGTAKQLRTTFFPLAHEVAGRWLLLGCSYMENYGSAGLLNDSGTADYGTTRMFAPNYVDIGFGLPDLQTLPTALTA